MRYFLLDKVTELKVGKSARGVKCVTLTDEVLHDHFPDHPIFPGALVVEAVAQLGGFLIEVSVNQEGEPVRRAVLVQIRDAKFSRPAEPGDRMDIRVRLGASLATAAQIDGEVYVEDARIARMSLTFMTREVDSARVNEQRTSLYRLWTRGLSPPPRLP